MSTEIILYKQQIASNPKFSIQADYGWLTNGTYGIDWDRQQNTIRKIPGTALRIYQEKLLLEGVQYQVRFNISARTAGAVAFKNKAGGTFHVNTSGNAIYDATFFADGTDIRLEADSVFDGVISNFSITEYPVMYKLDLTEEVSIPLNFSIDDIFKPQNRKTTFSKTVVLPGTHHNNIALDHIYKINSESSFDPNKSCRVVVLKSGITAFDGNLFIDQITKTVLNGIEKIEYSCTMYGELVSIMDKFGNKTIKDLDFSRWDHPYSITNILLSWNASFLSGFTDDLPYVYDNSTSSYLQNQQIIYQAAGDSISSALYNGINRVQIAFTSPHSFAVDDYLFIISENNLISGSQVIADIPDSTHIILHMAYANLTSTSFTHLFIQKRQWDALGYYYPMQDNGSYQRLCVNGDSAAGYLTQSKLYTVISITTLDDLSNIAKDPLNPANPITLAVGVTFLASDGGTSAGFPIPATVWENGTTLSVYDTKANGAKLYNKNLKPNHWHPTDFIPHIYVREAWNKMFSLIDYYYDCPLIDTNLFRRLVMPMDQALDRVDYTYDFNVPPPTPTEEQIITMNNWLPQMKLSEFFLSICNLFNLVILEDKDQNNIIRLVSRNDFFNGEQVGLKIDASKPLEIKLSNSYLPAGYQLKYKDGQDFYNLDYNKDFGNITNTNGITNLIDRKYGDYYLPTSNKISRETTKVELNFEPTVMVGDLIYRDARYAGGSPFNTGNDKVFSVTYSADANAQNVSRKVSNRILIAGVRGTDYPWSITANYPLDPAEKSDVYGAGGYPRWYSYAQHIDNIFDGYPYYDLNFGALLGQYFSGSFDLQKWASRTREGQDWDKYLLDITDPNGKIVTGYFIWSITDIYKLDFRNVFRFNTYSLKLNKITDWNVNSDGLCKVEFLLKNI